MSNKETKARIVDKSKLQVPAGTMEDFRRPNHNDFATASELQERKFSGYRVNSITEDFEIWVMGYLKRKVSKVELTQNPKAINEAFEQVFALVDVMPDTKEARLLREKQAEANETSLILPSSVKR